MKLFSLVATIALCSGISHADVLTLKPGTAVKQGVNISTGATAKVGETSTELTTVGSGLRKKKVVLIPIKVYVAQLLVSDQTRYVKTANGALASIDNQPTVAMYLKFLRDVPASNIKESFQASLDVNGVPANDPDIVKFMSLVDQVGAAETNGSLTIYIAKSADGSENLTLEMKNNAAVEKSMTGAQGLSHKLLSIWLGTPADDYLAELKAEMMQ